MLTMDGPPVTFTSNAFLPAAHLRDAGLEVHVVSRAGGPEHRRVEGIDVWVEPSTRAVASRIARLRPELYFCESASYGLLFGALGRSWIRNPTPVAGARGVAIQRVLLRAFDAVSFTSPALAAEWTVRPDRLVDLSYPVDVPFWSERPARRAETWAELERDVPRGPSLVFVANYAPLKRHAALVADLAPLLREREDVTLYFVGSGLVPEAYHETAATIARLDLEERVIVLGGLPRERIRDVLAWMDLAVFPTAAETQCLVLYESLLAGLPVVINRLPALVTQFPTLPSYEDGAELRALVAAELDEPGALRRDGWQARVEWADQSRYEQVFADTVDRLLGRSLPWPSGFGTA